MILGGNKFHTEYFTAVDLHEESAKTRFSAKEGSEYRLAVSILESVNSMFQLGKKVDPEAGTPIQKKDIDEEYGSSSDEGTEKSGMAASLKKMDQALNNMSVSVKPTFDHIALGTAYGFEKAGESLSLT